VQAEAEVHDTPDRTLKPDGVGGFWAVHVVPFHCSASELEPLLWPTATHADAEVQDTPDSTRGLGNDSFGVLGVRDRARILA
jgi:hypothetical protein